MNTRKVVNAVSIDEYTELIHKHSLKVNPHACDHISNAQRMIYNEESLKNILDKENPRGIGLQRNGRYSAFFRRKEGYIRIIFELKGPVLEIITFINVDSMPDINQLPLK